MQENKVETSVDSESVINPQLNEALETDSPMKEWLVDYVGNKTDPEDGQVTVEMIVDTLADEFPEFVMALAEENWIRGYQQGIHDVEAGRKMAEAELNKGDTESES